MYAISYASYASIMSSETRKLVVSFFAFPRSNATHCTDVEIHSEMTIKDKTLAESRPTRAARQNQSIPSQGQTSDVNLIEHSLPFVSLLVELDTHIETKDGAMGMTDML
jgi:hypothetical protein